MTKFTGIIFVIELCSLLRYVSSELRFAKSIGNHMVLQRAPESAILWGYSDVIGDNVNISINDMIVASTTTFNTSFGSNGSSVARWKVKLPPENRPGPFNITAMSSEGSSIITDVLFGDVWICSGQSNMQFKMREVYNSTAEIEDSINHPNIRTLFSKLVTADTQQEDVIVEQTWRKPTKGYIEKFSALCFMFARDLQKKLRYPIGLIESNWGGTPIEVWSSPDVIKKCAITEISPGFFSPRTPSVLWNSMIHPYLETTIKGAIWYQGEANIDHPDKYSCLFPTMIRDWRKKFNAGTMGETSIDFPFGFVQLAPWRPYKNLTNGFPRLRWSQSVNIGYVPNHEMEKTFMAVAIDLPDYNSTSGPIHPRYKQPIAARLSLGTQNIAYGDKSVVFQAPFPTQYLLHSSDNTLEITFDNGNAHLIAHSSKGFEICCTSASCEINSTSWFPCKAKQTGDTTVTLNVSGCSAGQHVGAIRYLWLESPCSLLKCPLYGRTNYLPVPPFIHMGPFNTTRNPSFVG